jgi:hypothetical protein
MMMMQAFIISPRAPCSPPAVIMMMMTTILICILMVMMIDTLGLTALAPVRHHYCYYY